MDLTRSIILGVAGNVAGHLEQAGEADDFRGVETADPNAPKGLFPVYVPGAGEHFLSTFPISSDRLVPPKVPDHLQIEPELALFCELHYSGGRVQRVAPTHFAAHDDCTIRAPGAEKISQKKNWGADSKGTADAFVALDRFEPRGVLDRFRLASYLLRDGVLEPYGIDSPVTGYSYFYAKLLDWLVDRMNHQRDEGPLESIAHWLEVAGRPETALISVGATRYTPFGESHFLESGDEAVVALYDARERREPELRAQLASRDAKSGPGLSLLRQRVV